MPSPRNRAAGRYKPGLCPPRAQPDSPSGDIPAVRFSQVNYFLLNLVKLLFKSMGQQQKYMTFKPMKQESNTIL